jgi:hypothetical protein
MVLGNLLVAIMLREFDERNMQAQSGVSEEKPAYYELICEALAKKLNCKKKHKVEVG